MAPGEVEGGTSPAPEGGATPVDAGAGDNSFALNDEVMGSDLDSVEIEAEGATPASGDGTEVPAKPGEVAPTTPVEPEVKPAVVATPTTPATPEVKPAIPATPLTPAAATTPSQARPVAELPPAELAVELGKNRDALIENLAQTRFALSQSEKDALEVDAVAAIPKLLARLYFEATTTSLNQIANMVPRLVNTTVTESVNLKSAEDQFFSAWPAIDRNNADHTKATQIAVNTFRQMNPGASREDAIKAVGTMVTAMFGLKAPVANGGNGSPRPKGSAPFAPASGVARSTAASTQRQVLDDFAGLGATFDNE